MEVLRAWVRRDADKVLLLGNAYPDDVQVLADAVNRKNEAFVRWKIVIIPSRPAMAGQMKKIISGINQSIRIVPVMGRLMHYYSCADIAWVGGGFSKAGIHNTLEPAFFRIPVISGPNLDDQPDAMMNQDQKILRTFDDPDELLKLLSQSTDKKKENNLVVATSPTALIIKTISEL